MPTAATSRKLVNTNLPAMPGKAQPNAMPSFSMNCNSNNPGINAIRSPNEKFNLTHTFRHWSANKTVDTRAKTQPKSVRGVLKESLTACS